MNTIGGETDITPMLLTHVSRMELMDSLQSNFIESLRELLDVTNAMNELQADPQKLARSISNLISRSVKMNFVDEHDIRNWIYAVMTLSTRSWLTRTTSSYQLRLRAMIRQYIRIRDYVIHNQMDESTMALYRNIKHNNLDCFLQAGVIEMIRI